MANTSSSAALQFSNLLKQSKALHLSADTVITSQAGYLHRNDYGLKRPLPASLKRSPYVKVRQMDSKHGQTDFVSAAKEGLFVRKWDETLAGLKTNKGNTDPYFITASPFDTQQPLRNPLDFKSKAAVETSGKEAEDEAETRPMVNGPMPDYMTMSETEFSSYLDELRSLQTEYRAYLTQLWVNKKKRELKQSSPAQGEAIQAEINAGYTDDMYEHALKSSTTNGTLVVDFLRSPIGTAALQRAQTKKAARLQTSSVAELQSTIPFSPHVAAGLSYIPQDAFYATHQARPVPARILHVQAQTSSNVRSRSTSGGMTTSALGLSAAVNVGRTRGLGETQFHPESGVRNDKQGRGMARIIDAEIDERTFDGGDDMHKKVYAWEVSKASEGVAKIPAVELDFKESELQTVIGSREWVYQGEHRPQKQQKRLGRDDVLNVGRLPKPRQPSKGEVKTRKKREDEQRQRWQQHERDVDVVGSI